jgi:predicted metal-dependent peptidase
MSNMIERAVLNDMCKKRFTGGSETAVRLMLRYPWFMVLYYSMTLYETDELPTLATNGVSMWVNPKFWNQLTRDQKMTAVAHELGHKMLLHPTRRGDRDHRTFNIAGDHVINLMLIESGFEPLKKLTIDGKDWNWHCDAKYKGWSTEQVYDDLVKETEDKGTDAGDGLGAEGDLIDFGEAPDGEPDTTEGPGGTGKTETVEQFEQRIRKELKEAETMSKMQGNVPAWMERVLGNAEHSKVPWYEVLEQYIKTMHRAEYSWSRWSKRDFIRIGCLTPDMWQPAMGGMVVYVDCSGSCWSALDLFNKHFKDIVGEVKPQWIEVRYFQTEVMENLTHRFERGDFEVELRPGGGGGTSFKWLADDIDSMEEKPEVAIVLTDMYGDFGRETDVPLFWASVSSVDVAPFGSVLQIN